MAAGDTKNVISPPSTC